MQISVNLAVFVPEKRDTAGQGWAWVVQLMYIHTRSIFPRAVAPTFSRSQRSDLI